MYMSKQIDVQAIIIITFYDSLYHFFWRHITIKKNCSMQEENGVTWKKDTVRKYILFLSKINDHRRLKNAYYFATRCSKMKDEEINTITK